MDQNETCETCATCGGEVFEDEGIWYHARIEDFSHLARPEVNPRV